MRQESTSSVNRKPKPNLNNYITFLERPVDGGADQTSFFTCPENLQKTALILSCRVRSTQLGLSKQLFSNTGTRMPRQGEKEKQSKLV